MRTTFAQSIQNDSQGWSLVSQMNPIHCGCLSSCPQNIQRLSFFAALLKIISPFTWKFWVLVLTPKPPNSSGTLNKSLIFSFIFLISRMGIPISFPIILLSLVRRKCTSDLETLRHPTNITSVLLIFTDWCLQIIWTPQSCLYSSAFGAYIGIFSKMYTLLKRWAALVWMCLHMCIPSERVLMPTLRLPCGCVAAPPCCTTHTGYTESSPGQ